MLAGATGIYGRVTETSGLPLPFANVFIDGDTRGCATNLDGYYRLDLEPGTYTVVARYLGYSTLRQTITVAAADLELNFLLNPESLTMQEVVISGGEDPAMAIMRKAIANRELYRRETTSFSTDVYIKGLQQIDEAPEKILGIRIDAGDLLDSNNTGIVYLSESLSRLHVQDGGTPSALLREDMVASKVSGNDQGFSWNEAGPMEISFYEPRMDISGLSERHFVSPLSDDAFFFYRFVLVGSYYEDGELINKIEVVPRRPHDPVFRGYIYIVEDSWRIFGTDLLLIRDAGIEFVDSLEIKMSYAPVDDERWMPVSRQFRFRFGLLGIRGNGYFLSFYSQYDLDPQFSKGFFGPEVLAVREGANEKDSLFWTATRPVPLSSPEIADYQEKDSLAVRRKSPEYLDSLDRVANTFQFMDALLGYSHENSFQKSDWFLESPLNSIGFTTVEGWFVGLSGGWSREMERNREWRLNGNLRYGTGNGHLQADARIQWANDPLHFQRLDLAGGKKISDYHPAALSPLVNTAYSLLLTRNYLKLYESTYAEFGATRQIFNGMQASLTLYFAERVSLRNTSDLTWIESGNREYTSNDPLDPDNPGWSFEPNRISRADLTLRYQIAQRYASEPDRRYLLESKWPKLRLHYQGAFPVFGSEFSFTRLDGGIEFPLSLGLVGQSEFSFSAGGFVQSDSLIFPDYRQFNGNQTIILRPGIEHFSVLPYFARSTSRPWVELHWEHHFNGFLFNRIPGIRELGWQLVCGGHALQTREQGWYGEIAVGIEHIFKVGRVEFAAGWGEGDPRYGVLFGVGF